MYHIVSLTIVTLLYITSPELILPYIFTLFPDNAQTEDVRTQHDLKHLYRHRIPMECVNQGSAGSASGAILKSVALS